MLVFTKCQTSFQEQQMHYMTSVDTQLLRKSFTLPDFVAYLADGFIILFSLMSCGFCVTYSLQWGTNVACMWLVSVLFGLVLDVCILEPLVIISVTAWMTYYLRRDVDLHFYYNTFKNRYSKKRINNNNNNNDVAEQPEISSNFSGDYKNSQNRYS